MSGNRPFLMLLLLFGCGSEPISKVIDINKSECLGCEDVFDLKRCADGLDNDEDLLVDCFDPDCQAYAPCLAVLADEENTAELCGDDFDNDENGFTDCQDFGCVETDACKPATPEPEDTDAKCYDLLDNDHDGLIDCRDQDCGAVGVTVCERNDVTCADGLDNDGNGYTDCGDFSCSQNPDVTICQ